MDIMSNDLIKQIKRYQHCIQQINPVESDAHRVLHCIRKLSKLPIKLEELENTGIGKTINSLRKSDGSVAEEATLLVAKWKAIVKKQVEEEEEEEEEEEAGVGQGSDVENHDGSDSESGHSSCAAANDDDVEEDADFASEPTTVVARYDENQSRKSKGGGGGDGGESKSKYEENCAPAASKVRLITIKKESSHEERKRKHSAEEKADRGGAKREKYKKIDDRRIEASAAAVAAAPSATAKQQRHRDGGGGGGVRDSYENRVQPEAAHHHQNHHHHQQPHPNQHQHQYQNHEEEQQLKQHHQHKDKNGDVAEERCESSASDKRRNKDRESDKRSSHKKDHEKRHHKSGKHKEEKSQREGKHRDDRDKRRSHHEKKHDSDDKYNSHKHKRDKKSKIRDKDENNHSRRGDTDGKSNRESSEIEVSSRKSSSRDANSYKAEEIAGDDFGAALLGIPTTAASPKKRATSSSKSSIDQDSPPTFSSPKSNSSLDFLSSNVKLEPLSKDLDVSDVPDYVPETYKASSRLTTSNKLDERTSPSYYSPQPKPPAKPKGLSDEDMFSSMVLMKNRRTKVYHGFKGNSKCPTLFELCVRVLQDNFDALEYTGGVPYEVLKPILEKVSVEQLYTFENYNPYLIGETDELWEHHAKKHFRKAERQEYETWRDLYLRCVEEREEKLQSLTENISQSIANSTPVRKTKLAYVDAVVKPPRNVARQQAKHGTGVSSNSAVRRSPKEPQPSPSAVQSVKERLAKEASSPNAIQIPTKAVKKKAAPLMQKTLQLFKGLKR